MQKKINGLKKYESILGSICNTNNIYDLEGEERNGCLGVACLLAYMEGTPPYLVHLSKKLEVDQEELAVSYDRLRINGIFSNSYNAYSDKVLKSKNRKMSYKSEITPEHETEIAWGIIAGIASGFAGLK